MRSQERTPMTLHDPMTRREEILPVEQVGQRVEAALFGPTEPRVDAIRASASVRVGRYVLGHVLGRGGMGVVYAAEDPVLGRPVAIKILADHIGAAARARMRREAEAMARASHPHVVQVYDVGEQDQRLFIAMELVDGSDLHRWLRARSRTPAEILDAFGQAARGLAAAHRVGLVHLDFKPSNALVDRDGRVKVADFGLSRTQAGGAPSAGGTRPSSALTEDDGLAWAGTPAYMPPEQHDGRPTDPRSDQYAWCAALWEALWKQPPFGRGSLSQLRMRKLEQRLEPPPPDAWAPRWLRRLLERGLRARIDQRWPSMDALLEALERRPHRRRRVALAVGAVMLASLSGTLGSEGRVCPDGAELVEAVWNDATRERAQQAFDGIERRFAADAWVRSQAAVDGWLGEWQQVHSELCEVPVAQRDTQHDRAVRCLDEGLHDLGGLVELLGSADLDVARRATAMLEGLARPSRCLALDSDDEPAPPGDPWLASQVLEVRSTIREAQAVSDAGKHARALELVDAALARARELGWSPVVAQAEREVGVLLVRLGRSAEAYPHFDEALALAREVGDDRLGIDVMSQLMFTLAIADTRPEDALEWRPHVEAALRRVGSDPELMARYDGTLALALLRSGRVEEARVHFDRALAARYARGEHDTVTTLSLRNNRLETIEILDGLEACAAEAEAVLAARERLLGPWHPDVARSVANLGVILRRSGEYERAAEVTERAEQILVASDGPDHPSLAVLVANRATSYRYAGRYDEALALYERVEQLITARLGPMHPELVSPLIGQAKTILERRPGDVAGAADALARLHRAEALLDEGMTSSVAFSQAKARWILAVDDAGRREALALARQARVLSGERLDLAEERAEIDAWLASLRRPDLVGP